MIDGELVDEAAAPLLRILMSAKAGTAHWWDLALCAETDPEAFFPEKGASTREAKRVCMACPVKAPCLEYALEHDERFGIFGGKSERERRAIKRRREGRRAA